MSRDFTPRESLAFEQYTIKKNGASLIDFMKGTTITYNGETCPLYSPEEIALAEEFPLLGKLYNGFGKLHEDLSQIEGGVELLNKKEEDLSAYVSSGAGDRNSYLIKWFEGELDECFHYSERNNELFAESLQEEAKALSRVSLDEQIQSAKEKNPGVCLTQELKIKEPER